MNERTSDNVKEVVLAFFLLADLIAEIATLAFVANGTKTKATKNGGILADVDKLWTLSIRGSASSANMTIPTTRRVIAFVHSHIEVFAAFFFTNAGSARFFCKHRNRFNDPDGNILYMYISKYSLE